MPLSTFLSDPWPAHHVVAADRCHRLTMGELRARVAGNTRRIAERCAQRAMLVCDHGDAFVVGLYSLLYAGRHLQLDPSATITLKVKFRRLVHAGDCLTLDLRYRADCKRLFFDYRDRGEARSTGHAVFQP